MKKEDTKTYRVGEERFNNQGILMRVVAYRKTNDIDVLFLNGTDEIKTTRYCHFLSGKVRCDSVSKKEIIKTSLKERYNVMIKNGGVPIPFSPRYFVDREGNVYNRFFKRLKPVKRGKYLAYDIPKEGENHRIMTIHRIMAITFLDKKEGKAEVNHKDGNKYNNNLDNLEWVNKFENQKHRFEVLLQNHYGIKNPCSKLKEHDVLAIFKSDDSYSNLAKLYGVAKSTISQIKNGYRWNHITNLPPKENKDRFNTIFNRI